MHSQALRSDVNFTGAFVPDPDTAIGRLVLRICIGTDSREELENRLRWEMIGDGPLRDADITQESVPEVVDWLIQDHNTQVPFPSQTALGLITAFEELTAEGIVFGFGEGRDVMQSLTAVSNAANILAQEGHSIDGYCFCTAADVERMIFDGELFVAFGVFDETGEGAVRIGERITEAFARHDLQVDWNGTEEQRIQVIGSYAVPYVDLPE
ncbi:MAG TPA: hypothetical protein VG502_01025 [Flexivirga sp.]|uniref:DUF6891 domain-containing protein n=1 Tax=Flexivirga sp. TaxID=1962927 RepID=UPI002B9CB77A|nr:hypothetical protein [Flexivirga sp.]HWC20855.1 hypothetical protein [Flexivirga sp.]